MKRIRREEQLLFQSGLYTASVGEGIVYGGDSLEIPIFMDTEMLTPDEFVERFDSLSGEETIGARFDADDINLWLSLKR